MQEFNKYIPESDEAKAKLEAEIERTRRQDEEAVAFYQEMKRKTKEVTEELGKPDLEEKSHQMSQMWSDSISMTLSKPVFAEKDNEQSDHENEIDKLILAHGRELAEYLLQKKKRMDEEKLWPTKDDRFTSFALFKFGMLKENLWPEGNQV